jgi:hypothetical protein
MKDNIEEKPKERKTVEEVVEDILNITGRYGMGMIAKSRITEVVEAEREYQREELEGVVKDYQELIMAVESKFEGETRHQTALRYIKQAETQTNPAEAR